MFRILSMATLIFALGIIFAPDATLNYVNTVFNAVKQKTGIGEVQNQIENNFFNAVEAEGRELVNRLRQ